jgi:uncharacterized membrane protein
MVVKVDLLALQEELVPHILVLVFKDTAEVDMPLKPVVAALPLLALLLLLKQQILAMVAVEIKETLVRHTTPEATAVLVMLTLFIGLKEKTNG